MICVNKKYDKEVILEENLLSEAVKKNNENNSIFYYC